MRRIAVVGGLVLWMATAGAFEFTAPLSVMETGARHFVHLDGSGRRLLAVNGQQVAVVWEDSRDGQPAIRAAFRTGQGPFTPPVRISGKAPAWEPAVAALGKARFVICWEAAGRVHCRQAGPGFLGTTLTLGSAPGRQISLAAMPDGGVTAVWGERRGRHYRIVTARLRPRGPALQREAMRAVAPDPGDFDQQYPAIAITARGTVVAWEDRRQGATRIFTAFAPAGGAFGPWQLLNDFRPSRIRRFGQGTGAMRPALAGDGRGRVVVTWLDKRDFEGGYDVYAALSVDGGEHFGADELVQDPLGENTPQWHPAVAMDRQGRVVVAWDDTREGNPDVWYSRRGPGGWSDDDSFPGSEGEARQTHPALAFDARGRLHVIWREQQGDRVRLRYTRSR